MSEAKQIRVLIAEDHLIARVGISTIINAQAEMVVVAEAVNGLRAVELYREVLPDVVVMDIRMPVMNGIEAIAKICGEWPRAHIVALSTYSGDQDVRRALDAGALSYLTKEVLHDELLNAIRAVHAGRTHLPPDVAAAVAAQWRGSDLTSRELEVLTLIVKGMSNKHIAFHLQIAEHTVKNHVKSILSKLGADDRTQAATAAVQRGIVHLP